MEFQTLSLNRMRHEKKCWPEFFQRVLDGTKTFEIRLADWECHAGDELLLKEWDPSAERYTGREVVKTIAHVFRTKEVPFWPEEDVRSHGFQCITFASGTRICRPWGSFDVLLDTPTHKVKTLTIDPGKRISYQRHQKRTEHWVVVSGVADITLDDETRQYWPGDTIKISQGTKHRLANPGPAILVVTEVQLGTYFGEDDIERFDDDFGRT